MEAIHETCRFTIHSDKRTTVPKWFLDTYSLKSGDRISVVINGITRQAPSIKTTETPEVATLVEAKVAGKQKIVDQPRVEKGELDKFPKKNEKAGLEAVSGLRKGT